MSKEVKEGSWESRGSQKHENSVVCKISQPKIGPCENGHLLRNDFAALRCPLRNQGLAAKIALCCEMISQPNTPLCKNFRSTVTPFRSCEMAAKSPKCEISNFRSHNPISQGVSQLRNTPLAHECHFTAPYTHFAAAKWLRNLHTLKSFSAHTMNGNVAATPLLDTFRSTS